MREIRVSTVNARGTSCSEQPADILKVMNERLVAVTPDKPDLILMSELFANHPTDCTREAAQACAQSVPGPVSEEIAAHARRLGCYIAFGLLRECEGRFYNSIVMLDRDGKQVWTYDKTTPMPIEMTGWGVTPGALPKPLEFEFGRVGGAICFDINYLEMAEYYQRQSVELLLFCSAFPAGRLLDIWALRYGMNVVGSTWYDYNRIIDCAGRTVASSSDILPYATAILNLNRRVVHMDGNWPAIENMRQKYPGDVLIEDMRDEATCIITSLKKGLEVADLIKEFEIEPLPTYFDRCRAVRADHGGLPMPKWW